MADSSVGVAVGGRQERVARVCEKLRGAGVEFELRELADNTSTAKLAAAALGCGVAEIAKSVVFCRRRDNSPLVAVLCGDNRVDAKKLAAVAGGEADKADAAYVNLHCGFEIGGVAPLAHRRETLILMDAQLRRFGRIWAAAGSAHSVFGIAPDDLARAAGATVADIAE